MEYDFCLEIDIDDGEFIVFYIRSYNSFFLYKNVNYFACLSDLNIIL